MISKVTKEVSHDERLWGGISGRPQVYWHDETPAGENFDLLGRALAMSDDLFRRPGYDGGLFLVLPNRDPRNIITGKQLSAVITDRIDLYRFLNGKQKLSRIAAGMLNEMLYTEAFLSRFATVDRITSQPEYLPGFTLTNPGYNDGGDGHRCFFVGESPEPSRSMKRINTFLDGLPNRGRSSEYRGWFGDGCTQAPLAWRQAHYSGDGVQEPQWQGHSGKDTVARTQCSTSSLGRRPRRPLAGNPLTGRLRRRSLPASIRILHWE